MDPVSEHSTSVHSERDSGTRRPRTPAVAIWISAAALLLCVLLALPYLALRSPVGFLFLALAVAGAIAGIVLGVRARRSAVRGGWALICAVVALLITAVMTVIFIVAMISINSINEVELRGQGPDGVSSTFSNAREERTETWPAEGGWARFNTRDSWAELTLEVPDDVDLDTVSCQIIWNGEVVVEETSETGSVTCRYDAD